MIGILYSNTCTCNTYYLQASCTQYISMYCMHVTHSRGYDNVKKGMHPDLHKTMIEHLQEFFSSFRFPFVGDEAGHPLPGCAATFVIFSLFPVVCLFSAIFFFLYHSKVLTSNNPLVLAVVYATFLFLCLRYIH